MAADAKATPQWSGAGACVTVLLDDPEPFDSFAHHVAAVVAERGDCRLLRVAPDLALLDPEAFGRWIAEQCPSHTRLCCAGQGSSADAALALAAALDADAVLAVAPTTLDGVASLRDAHAGRVPDARIVIGWEPEAGAPLPEPVDGVVIDATKLPSVAVVVALEQSGKLPALIDGLVAGEPAPPLTGLREAWVAAMAHRFAIDAEGARLDGAGGLKLSGRLHNLSQQTLLVGGTAPDRLLLGARLLAADGRPIPGAEARAALAPPALAPGREARFQLYLPGVADKLEEARLVVSLICEGRFWYHNAGFDRSPASPPASDAVPPAPPLERTASLVVAPLPAPVLEFPMSDSTRLERYKRIRSATGKEATLDDLWYCYRLFLDREPDAAGFDAYAAVVERGATVDELMRMFISSPEYARRLQSPADPTITRASLDGFDLFVPSADAVVGEEILSRGVYEPHVTAAIAAELRPGQCFVDIGANIGYFTVLAARALGASGRVIAIEPLARNVRLLLANCRINQLDTVDVLPFGVGEHEGFVTLLSMGSIASSRPLTLEDVTGVNALEFAYARTIDAIVPPHRRVDILKIDIDGFDHKALLGARATLERDHPVIFAEFAPALLHEFSGIDPADYLRYLLRCGYTDFTVLHREGDPEPLGQDIARIAALPERIGVSHVDLVIRRR